MSKPLWREDRDALKVAENGDTPQESGVVHNRSDTRKREIVYKVNILYNITHLILYSTVQYKLF